VGVVSPARARMPAEPAEGAVRPLGLARSRSRCLYRLYARRCAVTLARGSVARRDHGTRATVGLKANPARIRGDGPMVRVLLADDHAVVREGLRMFLALDPELEIVGEARNGQEAVRLTRELRPAVVLMDLLMPVLDGVAATACIRRELPETEVVALTSVLED